MPAFSWNHSAFVKGEACKRRKPPCIGDGFLRFESINWLLPAGFFGLPLRLHETVQLFMIAIRFAVHTAAVRLAVNSHTYGEVNAGLPVRTEVAVHEDRSAVLSGETFSGFSDGFMRLIL